MDQRELLRYYASRIPEYERVYAKPERQADLRRLEGLVRDRLRGRDVLEVACGTGYWTAVLAGEARSILATDALGKVLDVARGRAAWPDGVRFSVADAFDLRGVAGTYDGCFAGFLWSHVPRSRLPVLLRGLCDRLAAAGGEGAPQGPGSRRLVFVDNCYAEGSNTPIARRDDEGNTYQRRRLDSGEEFEVLKNFPGEDELRSAVAPFARAVEVVMLRYYWMVACEVGA